MHSVMELWLFGYGSLLWRPDFPFEERIPARLHGWTRRFWQASMDHRGVPELPGRVVTLVPSPQEFCDGAAYRVSASHRESVLQQLDVREQGGYVRRSMPLHLRSGSVVEGIVYVGHEASKEYVGEEPLSIIAERVRVARGPSGSNREYVLRLAELLRALEAHDAHVFALEALLLE